MVRDLVHESPVHGVTGTWCVILYTSHWYMESLVHGVWSCTRVTGTWCVISYTSHWYMESLVHGVWSCTRVTGTWCVISYTSHWYMARDLVHESLVHGAWSRTRVTCTWCVILYTSHWYMVRDLVHESLVLGAWSCTTQETLTSVQRKKSYKMVSPEIWRGNQTRQIRNTVIQERLGWTQDSQNMAKASPIQWACRSNGAGEIPRTGTRWLREWKKK